MAVSPIPLPDRFASGLPGRGLRWPGIPRGVLPAAALVLVVAAPLLALLSFVGEPTDGLWAHLARTVLAEYLLNTALLCLGVATLAVAMGTGTAWLVTMYRFPGQRILNWALVLPLAMPAYVLAYAYTDALQVTGPVQALLRDLTGWGVRDYWFPNVRSLGGAVFVLAAVLYPYVYVLARAAFVEQSVCALEVSRTLGCSPLASFRRIGLPLARPAIAAGLAFVVMETLADYGTVAYFEVRTFTTGIYRAWYALGSPAASAQLALCLLGMVALVLAAERLARGRARFENNTSHIFKKQSVPLTGAKGLAATLACSLPLLFGFVLPAASLAGMALGATDEAQPARLLTLAGNTALLGAVASVVVVAVAVAALLGSGRDEAAPTRRLVRAASLGYAVPGAVVGVGILVTLGSLDGALASLGERLLGTGPGLVLGGTVLALVYGYLVRFFAVAYNPLDAGLAKITPGLEDAARVLGCRPAGVLRRLRLPLLRASLLSALLLVFVDVMKELPATMILRPFNFDTLAVEAFQLATNEQLAAAALPSLLIVLAGLVPVVV
ncbi:MAG TPA: iron ABC transporter permease, partial [Geminicoccaceae bacterium]